MTPRLSIIVPTLGRETLRTTLDSIAPQLGKHDEVILIADTGGNTDMTRRLVVDHFNTCAWRYAEIAGDDEHGYAQRRYGMLLAKGTHLAFMDDDDVYEPDALRLMRIGAAVNPGRPVIFRMQHPRLDPVWREPILEYGNVGTPMFVVPNQQEQLGEWGPYLHGAGGDYAFIRGCVDRIGEPVWRPEVIATVRPHETDGQSHRTQPAEATV